VITSYALSIIPEIIASVSYELFTPIALAFSESRSLMIGSGLTEPEAGVEADAVGLENAVVAAPPENFDATVDEVIPVGRADEENLLLVEIEFDLEFEVSKSSSSSSKSRSSSSSSSS